MHTFKRIFLHSRFYPVSLALAAFLVGQLGLRLLLYFKFSFDGTWLVRPFLHALVLGFRLDLVSAIWFLFPIVLWLFVVPHRWIAKRWHRFAFALFFSFYLTWLFFILIADYNFFEEFNAHFNTVAVDYLIYPQEVFVNLWDSYPLGKILTGLAVFMAITAVFVFRAFKSTWKDTAPLKIRILFLSGYCCVGLLSFFTMSMQATRFSPNRVLNEVASDGVYSFVYAALTRHLDYPAFYKTVPRDDAYARARRLVSQPNAVLSQDPFSIRRSVQGNGVHPKYNLVVILVESFGAEFWGSLGRAETFTPRMDALAKEGVLFTNLYASGNRTVRGMEGVLASFPPLPGDSIVKRHLSDNVSTLARTLKKENYQTVFLYGGRGVFDGMRSFNIRNGYDRFIEQKDFSNPSFTTVWGVADEDLGKKAVDEMREMSAKGPFFVTLLTVSNHKPYTYPEGRIPEKASDHSRANAVKYTDWALGDFFERAKKEKFYKDTIFAVVADHGARIYGSQTIPIQSYKIPLLVVGANVPAGVRNDMLGGSLDVGPTLFGFLGLIYKSVFFGRDLFHLPKKDSWAVMNHNRDVGFYRDGRLVVLGINKKVEYYHLDTHANNLERVSQSDPVFDELEKDTMALYQVADELYTSQTYRAD